MTDTRTPSQQLGLDMTSQTLEETLNALCAEHDLTYLGIQCHKPKLTRPFFSATLQWDGLSKRNLACASANEVDISTAVSVALSKMREDRTPTASEASTLPAFEVAS